MFSNLQLSRNYLRSTLKQIYLNFEITTTFSNMWENTTSKDFVLMTLLLALNSYLPSDAETYLEPSRTSMMEHFGKNNWRLSATKYFRKNLYRRCSTWC